MNITIDGLLNTWKHNRSLNELRILALARIELAVTTILNELPKVPAIVVEGYTPYFNDGDVCRFRLSVAIGNEGEGWQSRDPINNTGKRTEFFDTQDTPRDKLKTSVDLMYCLQKEFELLDTNNGTIWWFVRDANSPKGFRLEEDYFDHD